jgi:hypothetical protein
MQINTIILAGVVNDYNITFGIVTSSDNKDCKIEITHNNQITPTVFNGFILSFTVEIINKIILYIILK